MKHLLLIVAGMIMVMSSCVTMNKETRLKRKAARIHDRILTVDTHVDTPLRLINRNRDLGQRGDPRQGGGKLDFIRMQEGGLDAAWFATYVGQGDRTPAGRNKAHARVMDLIQTTYNAVAKNSDLAEIGLNSSDAARLEKAGKRAIFFGIENGYAIGEDLYNLESFYNLGVRYMTLCHVKNNDICDSSGDTTEHNGLSEFGRQVVPEMNRLGMLIDVSHISDKAYYDVLELTEAPVIASHSCARAIRNHDRNMDDEMLRALAENGGVIQMNILSYYVKKIPQDPRRDSLKTAWKEKWHEYDDLSKSSQKAADKEYDQIEIDYPQKLATVSHAADHIDHMVKVAGIDHVGIGTDFDGGGALEDCYDVSEIGNITLELVRRGYGEHEIAKIWGGNLQRVFKEAEAVAGRGRDK